MNVNIHFKSGSRLTINIDENTTVEHLKETISGLTKIPASEICLSFLGKELCDGKTAADYGIHQYCVVKCKRIDISSKDQKDSLGKFPIDPPILKFESDDNSFELNRGKYKNDPPFFMERLLYLENLGFSHKISKFTLRLTEYNTERALEVLRRSRAQLYDSDESSDDLFEDEKEELEWKDEDIRLLIKKHSKYGNDWEKIGKYFPERTPKSIKKEWICYVKPKLVLADVIDADETDQKTSEEKEWTEKDDELLFQLWKESKPVFRDIVTHFPGRSQKEVFAHWTDLKGKLFAENKITSKMIEEKGPEIVDTESDSEEEPCAEDNEWTPYENELLIKLQKAFKQNWSTIASFFESRHNFASVKQHWREMNTNKAEESPAHVIDFTMIDFPKLLRLTDPKEEKKNRESKEKTKNEAEIEEAKKRIQEASQQIVAEGLEVKPWTEEEDRIILEKHKEIGPQWDEIAKLIPSRTSEAIRVRYWDTLRFLLDHPKKCNRSKKNPWTEEEDKIIMDKFAEFGPKFEYIASFIPRHNIDSVIARYYLIRGPIETPPIAPMAKEEEWTDEDNKLICSKYIQHDGNWDDIAAYFPTRSRLVLHSHWESDIKQIHQKMVDEKWQPEEDDVISENYDGTDCFEAIASKLTDRTPESVKQRYEYFIKNLNAEPESTEDTTTDDERRMFPAGILRGRKLDGSSKKNKWTDEENCILKMKVDQGLDFSEIKQFLPTRTTMAIKSHYDRLKELNKLSQIQALIDHDPSIAQVTPSSIMSHKNKWTDEEEKVLLEKIHELGPDWNAIGAFLPKRTPASIANRWTTKLKFQYPDLEKEVSSKPVNTDFVSSNPNQKIPWSEEEEKILFEKLKLLSYSWKEVASFLPGRTQSACQAHWERIKSTFSTDDLRLIPSEVSKLSKARWTSDEENTLMLKAKEYQQNWEQVKKELPNRTIADIKVHFAYLSGVFHVETNPRFHVKLRLPWTEEDNELLDEKVEECENNWDKIADFFPSKTIKSIQYHYYAKLHPDLPHEEDVEEEEEEESESEDQESNQRKSKVRRLVIRKKDVYLDWSKEEDNLLLQKMQEQNYNMSKVYKFFPTKKPANVQARYKQLKNGNAKPQISIEPIEAAGRAQRNAEQAQQRASMRWVTEEDQLLIDKINQYGENWQEIYKCFEIRSQYSIKSRWKLIWQNAVTTGATIVDPEWTEDEEELLKEKVEELGNKWSDLLPEYFPYRNYTSVKKHFWLRFGKTVVATSSTSKRYENAQWTPEEDQTLVEGVKSIGCNYRELQKMLPGRSLNQIKKHWNADLKPQNEDALPMFMAKHRAKNFWTKEENRILIDGKQKNLTARDIQRSIPNRTINQINNHWARLNEKRNKRRKVEFEDEDDDEESSSTTTEAEEEEEESGEEEEESEEQKE